MQAKTVIGGGLTAGSANAICLSQTPTAGELTLNGALVSGGVATMVAPRRVLITTTDDETGVTFLITGTNWAGAVISETLAGVNNTTAYSVLDYKTVTSIRISGDAAGALTVGTNGIGGSPWVRLDDFAPSNVSIQCNVSGTVNYTVQSSLDDPNDPFSAVAPADMTWISTSDTDAVGATASLQTNFLFAPKFVRILINSGTGTVTTTILQSSNGPI